MPFTCLKKNVQQTGDYKIVPLQEQDIFQIKDWRNEQIEILRQNKVLTDTDQNNYFKNIVNPSFTEKYPDIILFSFLLNELCIGYGGLTNISWLDKRAELSFLLNTKRIDDKNLYEQEFSTFISLIKKVAFDDLGFNRIFTETFDIRSHHISILEKNGFALEGRMKQHTLIKGQFTDSLIHGFLKEYYYA
jgi:RimJ/RimL family protein N-acetyltransferase